MWADMDQMKTSWGKFQCSDSMRSAPVAWNSTGPVLVLKFCGLNATFNMTLIVYIKFEVFVFRSS